MQKNLEKIVTRGSRHRGLFSSYWSLVTATMCAIAVTACGGGGGGGGAGGMPVLPLPVTPVATPTPTPDTPSSTPSTIVASVPAATYSAGSEEDAAFKLLNAERARCGFGKLAQNGGLDAAAKGHADWLINNNYVGHNQVAGTPGFTGVTPADRAAAAGYKAASVTEEQTLMSGSASLAGRGVFSVRSLLSAPYHLLGMAGGYRDVGISIRGSDDLGTTATQGARTVEQFELGFTEIAGAQEPSGDQVLTYPCAGTSGTFFELVNETPSPVPGRDLMASPLGHPILVAVRSGSALAVTSASLVTASGNTPVTLRATVTKANDVNARLAGHQALLIPDAALTPNTEYTVKITGKNGAQEFSKTFNFTTGEGTGRTR
ncbi:CAP domain-containing protein [Variovorax sp. ZS18.2.2]|uniref:Ig-like domain-containing protein n=1 Tax=Variovorax sp. ZS18.2.2 TaxID=2971255 RepID=UPI002150F0B6|nr:CAP domain-containing protein [Variovorax sp. ZS18.2.2]MCR6481022.1 CAP domain-containing protein [Variovorax sp. ZS18.2.2]